MKVRARTRLLFVAFLLTGVAVALLGASLPAMLREWHLSDQAAGMLLFSSFAGSTLGVIAASFSPRIMAGVGMVFTAIAGFLLSIPSPPGLWPCFLLYGLGLGTTMTSITMLRSREVPPTETTLELNRLNLIWATGACLAPALALHSLHLVSVHALFAAVACAFVVGAAALLIVSRWSPASPGSLRLAPAKIDRLAPLRMCLFAGAAVGLETAIGSWLTAYSQRMSNLTGIAVTANSAFWLGLLLSRAAHSVRAGRRFQSGAGLTVHLAAVTIAMGLLIGAPVQALLPGSAFLAGIGLGPLYPMVLSWALPRYRSGAVFMLAGTAASALPWITGALSTSFRSLRAGLLAPCAAVLVLLAAGVSMRRDISASSEVPA